MVKKIIFLFFFITTLTFIFAGCKKDDECTCAGNCECCIDYYNSLLDDGTVPETVIPPDLLKEFENEMDIFEGSKPPIINGEYLVTENVISYTSDYDFEPGDLFADHYIKFSNQDTDNKVIYFDKQANTTGTSTDVTVVGNGKYFTAFFILNSTHDDGVTSSKRSVLISGKMTDYGIDNFKYAFIMLEKNDPYGELMEVNHYRVFEDADGLALNYEWYDESTTYKNIIETILPISTAKIQK